MSKKYNKKPPLSERHKKLTRLGLFLAGFAVAGGGVMLMRSSAATTYLSNPPHYAVCTQNSPSKTYVRPNERFTAVVKMKNSGSSTFSGSYGFFLGEFNNGTATNYWNASGGSMSGDVPPGGTATFNLTVTAPAQVGTYDFNWAMSVVYQGTVRDPCAGQRVIVANPPAIVLNLNNQSNNIALTQGNGLTVSWSTTNSPSACNASGNWSGAKAGAGSENRSGDTASAGNKSYTLVCANQVGSNAITRTVTVAAQPVSAPPATPPAPTTSPRQAPSNNPAPATVPVLPTATDTTPPTPPANFSANFNQSVVDLKWDNSSDEGGVSGYELERSLDESSWQKLGERMLTDAAYSDKDVTFQTNYFYRIRALDQAGNASSYSTLKITTGNFEPNVTADQEVILSSDDGLVRVVIPVGALSEPASCDLRASQFLQPDVEGYAAVTGPYELLCKLTSGMRVSVFSKLVKVQFVLGDSQRKQYGGYKYYIYKDDWTDVSETANDTSFELGDARDFAIMGQVKKTPLWQKVLIGMLIAAAIIGGGLVLLSQIYRRSLRRRLEQRNRDQYNKEHGY